MGEIIIKVPEDVREVIETELPYREVRKKRNLKRRKKADGSGNPKKIQAQRLN